MDKLELVKKLKRILSSDSGAYDGERYNAKIMLENLSTKYNIDIDSIDENTDESIIRDFTYHGKFQKQLLIQIADKVCNRDTRMVTYTNTYSGRRCKTILGIECSEVEEIEIKIMFEFYLNLYNEDLEIFQRAFYQKHRLFGSYDHGTTSDNTSDEELERIWSMMSGISDKEYQRHKLLTD